MSAPPERIRSYLVPDESLRAVHAATLSENSHRKPMSVGVTDRRLVAVGEDDAFLSVSYDTITGVRSHSSSRVTFRGNDYRLVVGSGVLLAVLGLVGVAALSAGPLAPLLSLVTVGSLAAAAYLERRPDLPPVTAQIDVPASFREEFEGVYRLRRRLTDLLEEVLEDGDSRTALQLGCGGVALLSLLATVVLASSVLVLPAALLVPGGAALAAYGYRHRREFDGIEPVRRREREVRINTGDGRELHIRSEPSASIDRELSRLAFADGPERSAPVQPSERSSHRETRDTHH